MKISKVYSMAKVKESNFELLKILAMLMIV